MLKPVHEDFTSTIIVPGHLLVIRNREGRGQSLRSTVLDSQCLTFYQMYQNYIPYMLLQHALVWEHVVHQQIFPSVSRNQVESSYTQKIIRTASVCLIALYMYLLLGSKHSCTYKMYKYNHNN